MVEKTSRTFIVIAYYCTRGRSTYLKDPFMNLEACPHPLQSNLKQNKCLLRHFMQRIYSIELIWALLGSLILYMSL